MKRLLTLTALMASFCTAAASTAAADTLADQLPAGALLTLETRNAGPAIDRLLSLVGQLGADLDMEELSDAADGAGSILRGVIGTEGVAGVFTVGTVAGGFTPALLAVSRVDPDTADFLSDSLPKKAGARVGQYSFVRDDGMYLGLSNGLLYISSDKTLLMGYLGRLSGKVAPRLSASVAYSVPRAAVGDQEFGLYANFSAAAKVVRGQLGKVLLPRLLSPLVDALDTLGTYASGFSTNQTGLDAQSAQVPNPAGKDRPLYSILTHTTDFTVQDIIPADAESVTATACANETNGYVGRWLTRLDLLDPLGFLSDSQLAYHLDRSARYLGDECAQVTLAGGTKASLGTQTAESLKYSVTYQKVSDMDAAVAHLPEYVGAFNEALQGVSDSIGDIGTSLPSLPGMTANRGKGRPSLPTAAQKSLQLQLDTLKKSIGDLQLVYAFRGDYVLFAFSEEALQTALDEEAAVLADDADFGDAALQFAGVSGWSYGRALDEVSSDDVLAALQNSGQGSLSDLGGVLEPIAGVAADLINRYGGMSSQSTAEDGVILSTSSVRYDWKQ